MKFNFSNYRLWGGVILLLSLLITQSAIGQTLKTVSGVITDSLGSGIPNVSVKLKDKTTGVVSNAEGFYSIRAADGSIIEFSAIGYATQEHVVKNAILDIVLTTSTSTAGEEVVITGFSTQKKTTLASSISTIKGEDLNFSGRNLSTNLQGQIPGIIAFQRSGEPGYDNATFWIRGISTFNGVQNPLILVDGIPRSFSDIDPNEIATFSILKDAAATSVYGSEGANGVILVTTKRGRSQKTQITYRGEVTVSKPFKMPQFVGAPEFMEIYNEAMINDDQKPHFTQGRIDSTRQRLDPDLYPDVDWLGNLIRPVTKNTRHNLSFRGGTDRARYFVSGAYYSEQGIFNSNALAKYSSNISLNRYNLRSNIDLDVTNTTLLTIDLSGQYLTTNYPGYGTSDIFNTASRTQPYLYPMIYSNGHFSSHPNPSNNRANPYNMLNNSGYSNEYRTNIQSRVSLEQKLDAITPGLMAKGIVSFDFDGTFTAKTSADISTYYATGRDADGNLTFNKTKNGTGELTDGGTAYKGVKNIYMELSLRYKRLFNNKHDVSGMLLALKKERTPQEKDLAILNRLPFRKVSYIGQATYAYDRRYSVDVNIGITGSEQFTKENRFGIFPAVGAAWILSNEHFYSDALKDVLSLFKLRTSFGLTGNDATGGDRFLYRGGFSGGDVNALGAYLGYDAGGPLGGYSGRIEARFRAPGLTWEKEIKRNYGLDLGFLRNKINLTVEYFDNYRYDILLQRQTVSAVAGFRQMPWQNFGAVSNKGFDVALTGNYKIGDHQLGARGNFTFARNKVIERDEIRQKEPWMQQTGNKMNMPDIWQAERLFTEDDFNIATDAHGNKTYSLKDGIPSQQYFNADYQLRPGDIKYVDLNGDGVINQFDRTRYIGHPTTPEISYGFGLSYGYKGFSINMFFSGVANTSAVLGSQEGQAFFPFTWSMDESGIRTMIQNRWTEANPSQDVLYPRIRPRRFTNNMTGSTWWLRDMSFLRLKNVEIGYEVPLNTLKKLHLSRAKIYLMGNNLYTWSKFKLWDPEQGANNAGMTYPQSSTYTLGLELTL